jgi:hypothetical protein
LVPENRHRTVTIMGNRSCVSFSVVAAADGGAAWPAGVLMSIFPIKFIDNMISGVLSSLV